MFLSLYFKAYHEGSTVCATFYFYYFGGVDMHIPDNYLSPSTCAVLGAAMVPVWRRAANKVKQEVTRKKMPLLGVAAAFSFLIMMFNLPLPGGTTGHAVGAALAAILLGPYAAGIAVTIALAVQALFFGDGGILALGANTFNMAFVMPFVAHYVFRFIKGKAENPKRDYIAAFIAGYVSLNIAALLTAVQFGIQPLLFKDAAGMPLYCPYDLSIAIPAMMIPHILMAGFIEGAVTAGVYAYIRKVSPETIYENNEMKMKPLYALLGAMVLLSPLGLLATGTAWGEWGIEEIGELAGFTPRGMEEGFSFSSIMPDYTVANFSELSGYLISAVLGTVGIIVLIRLLHRYTKRA
jgi:cobalt/nickel transport system permease protein